MRKHFDARRIDPEIEFINFDRRVLFSHPDTPVYKRFYLGRDHVGIILRKIVNAYNFKFRFKDLDADIDKVGKQLLDYLYTRFGKIDIDHVDMIRPVFYRNKGAYMVGKMAKGNVQIPIVVPLIQTDDGVEVDTVLLTKDEISVVFSFTRSYFFVGSQNPIDLVHFLKPMMSHKRSSELFASIGYDKACKDDPL